MNAIVIDSYQALGSITPRNAIHNGPPGVRMGQPRSNLVEW